MLSSTVRTFIDPDAYHSAIRDTRYAIRERRVSSLTRIIHEEHRLARMSAETLAFCHITGTNPVGIG